MDEGDREGIEEEEQGKLVEEGGDWAGDGGKGELDEGASMTFGAGGFNREGGSHSQPPWSPPRMRGERVPPGMKAPWRGRNGRTRRSVPR